MKQEASKLLLDIQEAIFAIAEFTKGMTFGAYLVDAKTRAAVERKFEIVGEACSRLRDRCPEVHRTPISPLLPFPRSFHHPPFLPLSFAPFAAVA